MNPFEELYGKSWNTLVSWSDPVNRVLIARDMLADMEQEMKVIKKNLKATHDKHNSYADQHWEFKEFQVGEHVYL